MRITLSVLLSTCLGGLSLASHFLALHAFLLSGFVSGVKQLHEPDTYIEYLFVCLCVCGQAHVVSAFEQSLANMTARLQALTSNAEQKVQMTPLLHKSSFKVSR